MSKRFNNDQTSFLYLCQSNLTLLCYSQNKPYIPVTVKTKTEAKTRVPMFHFKGQVIRNVSMLNYLKKKYESY